jgi:hypothetical protein
MYYYSMIAVHLTTTYNVRGKEVKKESRYNACGSMYDGVCVCVCVWFFPSYTACIVPAFLPFFPSFLQRQIPTGTLMRMIYIYIYSRIHVVFPSLSLSLSLSYAYIYMSQTGRHEKHGIDLKRHTHDEVHGDMVGLCFRRVDR